MTDRREHAKVLVVVLELVVLAGGGEGVGHHAAASICTIMRVSSTSAARFCHDQMHLDLTLPPLPHTP